MKMGILPPVEVAAYDHPVQNLYKPVAEAFANPMYVIFYVVCMVVLGFHLWHGFWSSFQTLGINHRRSRRRLNSSVMSTPVGISLGFATSILMFLKS